MLKNLQSFIDRKLDLLPNDQKGQLIEKIFIAKYGDYDTAKKEVEILKDKYPNEDDLCNEIAASYYPESIKKLFSPLLNVNSIPQMLAYEHKIATGEIGSETTHEDAWFLYKIREAFKIEFDKIFLNNGKQLLFDEINKKVRFTLREIRNEIGLDQRTFKKWLYFFFGNRYDKIRTISLSEYIEIYQQLILKEHEEKFDFTFNAEEYYKRLAEGLVFSKARLTKLAGSDYKQLAIKMKSMDSNLLGMDVFPYRIAIKILEAMG